ncbi:BgTH12-05928 [Blumeria graminis f. sp. triticale]|uniref:BgTH12-05928 n=1 Tax=Blumeria graminis f. sp. triticale TaxID=1689686 RepID=A0A9W4DLX0_BLUGR|nr:BgTH12-05928 [Blumeria graminis f. sp. triticale]
MLNFPLKLITASSALSIYIIAAYLPDQHALFAYTRNFILAWIVHVFIWIVCKVIVYPKFTSPLRYLPSPEGGSWWNGQYPTIAKYPTGKPMVSWIHKVPNDGIMRYLGMFNSERVLITSPTALREVLSTRNYDFIKPVHVAVGLGRLLGIGVLLAEGEDHKRQRRNLLPAFAFRHIKNLYPGFWEKSIEVVEAMTAEVRAGGIAYDELPEFQKKSGPRPEANSPAVIEVGDWASRATLDIIGVAGMGQDFQAVRDPTTELNRTYRKVFKPCREAQILGLMNNFLPAWFVSRVPMKRNGDIEAAASVIRDICRKMIRIKKEKAEKNQLTDYDILSVALQSGGFSEENLVDQMMTFLAAGHETTSGAMTWAIYLLSVHQSVQSRLRDEIRATLPPLNSVETVTSYQIDNMPYLNAVCNEVLRYFPPVGLTMRDAIVDTSILGHRIPKGTRIIISPLAINRCEELWGPNAQKFDPERWLPSETNPYPANGGAASNYSFLTFLHGPRGCIGQAFSKAEFACLLAAWIGRFEFELNDERELIEDNLVIKGGVTSKLGRGLFVKTKIVDGW